MIVTDSGAQSPAMKKAPELPNVGSTSQTALNELPPAYYGGAVPPARDVNRRSATSRFISAFAVALIVYVIIAIFLRGTFGFLKHHIGGGGGGSTDFPLPGDGHTIECTGDGSWEDVKTLPSQYPPYSARVGFKLPLDTPLLYFLSHGSLSQGSITFETTSSSSSEVAVDVEVQYTSLEARSQATVCSLEKDEGGRGIGIYTPNIPWAPNRDRLRFIVTVHIPLEAKDTLNIKSLVTTLPLFSHIIKTEGRVQFEKIALVGTNGAIFSTGLVAKQAELATTNSGISGKYVTDESLSLHTTNGAINAEVELRNDGSGRQTDLRLQSTNGPIKTPISLVSTAKGGAGGVFTVNAATTNGRLDLSFPKQPLDSKLQLQGHSTNSGALVSLNPAYEGAFLLTTSNAVPTTSQTERKDPAGKGRKRVVRFGRVGRIPVLEGTVSWGDDDHPETHGSVVVSTTNGRNVLEL
jgi:hypothetical protein